MNIVDYIILAIIVIFALLGLKCGFLHSTVTFVGTILVVILSFIFKNYVSIILYENLPFFKFGGIFKNVPVVNILFYEVLAFLIVAIVLSILLKLIIVITKLIEKILKATIILSIPSKLAGTVVGAIEGYIITFVLLYILSLPVFNIGQMAESKYRNDILTKTPVLSGLVDETVVMIQDFEYLQDVYSKDKNETQFNLDALDIFLKYNIISIDSADKLVEQEKLQIDNIESVLQKYREEKNESTS